MWTRKMDQVFIVLLLLGNSAFAVSANSITLRSDSGFLNIPFSKIRQITFTTTTIPGEPQLDKAVKCTYSAKLIQPFMARLGLGIPEETDAIPAAMTTSTLAITYSSDKGIRTQELDVLNSRLVEDHNFPRVFYHPGRILDSSLCDKK